MEADNLRLYPFIGGDFVKTGITREIRAPFNDQLIGLIDICDEAAIEQAITAGENALSVMREMPSFEKFNILRFIADTLNTQRDYLAKILAMEAAKPLKYALAEIDRAAQTFLIAAEESKRIPKEYISLDWTTAGKNKEGLVKYFPIGLVAGISPFNFPMNLAVHKIAPAIAAGCPIVLKPASSTPLSTLLLAGILKESGLPPGAVNIVPSERKAGNKLVTDPRFKLLSFTGSDEVGWEMKKNAGKKKTVLELGGNAGVIIAESAALEPLLNSCLTGAFSYQGQVCIHAQRFYVHQKHVEAFTEAMVKLSQTLVYGAPEDPGTDVSVMIDQENADRVESWVNEAVQQGAVLESGGIKQGKYYAPTILTHTHPSMKVNTEEIFGPVITIEPYHDFETAVSMLNSGRFGLQAGVFTHSIREMDYAFAHIEAGGVILNEVPTLRLDHMPYGGVKDSGLGREGVRYAMYDMLEPKILVK